MNTKRKTQKQETSRYAVKVRAAARESLLVAMRSLLTIRGTDIPNDPAIARLYRALSAELDALDKSIAALARQ